MSRTLKIELIVGAVLVFAGLGVCYFLNHSNGPVTDKQQSELVALAIAAGLVLVSTGLAVSRFKRRNILLGTLTFWFVGGLSLNVIIHFCEPHDDGSGLEFFLVNGFWLMFGWLAGLIYCRIVLAIKRAVQELPQRNSDPE